MYPIKEYLSLKGREPVRVPASQVMRALLNKDRLGNHLLLVSLANGGSVACLASDENVSELLDAGLRVHEYVCIDGEIDYREIAESQEHFKSARIIPEWLRQGAPNVCDQHAA